MDPANAVSVFCRYEKEFDNVQDVFELQVRLFMPDCYLYPARELRI